MAKKIIHQLVDDLDGTVLDPGVGETVLFSLDGRAYEIDLTDGHAAQLREALAPYISAGRGVGRESSPAPRRRTARGNATANAAVRTWANGNGFNVSERGRIPASVQEAYDAAH